MDKVWEKTKDEINIKSDIFNQFKNIYKNNYGKESYWPTKAPSQAKFGPWTRSVDR